MKMFVRCCEHVVQRQTSVEDTLLLNYYLNNFSDEDLRYMCFAVVNCKCSCLIILVILYSSC